MCIKDHTAEIFNQVKFYFSDVNLVRDKFLKEKTNENDGWVTLDCLLTFNRLKKLTTDPKILLESLKSDKSLFFEIDEEKMKIRRSKDIPIPALSFRKYLDKKKANIFYIEKLPLNYSIDDIEKFLISQKIHTTYIKMLVGKERKFSGTIYILADTDETIKLLSDKNNQLIVDDSLLTVTTQAEYIESSSKDSTTTKRRKSKQDETQDKAIHIKNALLRMLNLSKNISAKTIKETLKEYGNVQWVDKLDNGHAIARFDTENAATEVIEKLKSDNGELKIGDEKFSIELVTGTDESSYWGNITKPPKRGGKFKTKKRKQH